MKRLLWLGLLFLSTSWLFFIPIFISSDFIVGLFILIVGIIFITLAFWKDHFEKINKKYLIILIPLLIFIFVIPFPYSLGSIILTVGVLFYCVKIYVLKNEKANWIPLGISLSGVILIVQTLFFPFYFIFSSHNHRVDVLSPVVSSFGGFFGLKTSVNNGIVYVQTLQQTYPFTTTWEKLGFYPWFNIMIGALFLFLLLLKHKKIGIYIIIFFLFSGTYLLFRYIFIIFFFTQTKNITLFWNPVILIISFIPLALFLMKFATFKDIYLNLDSFKIFKLNKNQTLAISMIFLFVFSLVGAFVFQDPGTPKQGRILIDELHSDWEDSTKVMDKEWYGKFSTYNYYCWAELLSKYYNVTKNIEKDLTYSYLKNFDILILKCPTDLYSDEEIKDIVKFVNNGGGLYLIGDHTNIFGMNFYLNLVAENFGIYYLSDATFSLETGDRTVYKPDLLFSHSIVKNVDRFEFLTSCTLIAPINSENVIVGNSILSEPGTYTTENFFRETIGSTDTGYGLLLQVAAVKYGKGRVVAFTDSTCFSNFCIFMDGYKNFNLGTIEYLNRINNLNHLNNILILISIISFIISIYLLKKNTKNKILFIFIFSGFLSFSIAAPFFSYINDINYQIPSEKTDFCKVCFEQEYSSGISSYILYSGSNNLENLFGTFFVWTQRINCFPSNEKTLKNALDIGDVVVVINPTKQFNDEDCELIINYIDQGGNILLMDSILNKESTANQLLKHFNLSIDYETINEPIFKYNNPISDFYNENKITNNLSIINCTIGNISKPFLKINGGMETYINFKNETSISVIEEGKGKILVVVDSYTFSDYIMGGTIIEPNESLRQIYDIEYYIFEELFSIK